MICDVGVVRVNHEANEAVASTRSNGEAVGRVEAIVMVVERLYGKSCLQ